MMKKNASRGVLRPENYDGIVAHTKTANRALEGQPEALNAAQAIVRKRIKQKKLLCAVPSHTH